MMWHKEYYKLDEAAKKLEVDTVLLLDVIGRFNAELDDKEEEWLAQDDDCSPNPNPYDEYFRLFAILDSEQDKRISKDVFCKLTGESMSIDEFQLLITKGGIKSPSNFENETVHLTHDEMWGIATEIFRHDISKIITAIENNNETVSVYLKTAYSLDDEDQVVGSKQAKEEIKLSQIVIRNHDLKRLLALKAVHDNKPTAEQLQQQLDQANSLIAELEAAQSNDSKGKQKQREQALSYWIAGKGLDTAKRMTQFEIHEELKLVNGLFQIAPSTFEDFWQTQKLVKLDAGKR